MGLIFDSKLTWKAHIKYIKAKCQQLIGILKSITAYDWGADMKPLVHLYRMFIRSKLGCGSIVYQSASKTEKNILEPVANECIRIATGAFRSTPIKSLNITANEMSLEDRRQQLSLK